jgi:hypothetical protein
MRRLGTATMRPANWFQPAVKHVVSPDAPGIFSSFCAIDGQIAH